MGRTWLGTSWKMNGTLEQARTFARTVAETELPSSVQPFVIPSFTAISAVRELLPGGGPVLVGAQNTHWDDAGAWTGEVSPLQLADLGCDLVEVGHSERRQSFGETDSTVNKKVKAILRHGMTPLVCFGETADIRDAGTAAELLSWQVAAALAGVEEPGSVILAYEPVWAIGETGRPARTDEIQQALEPVLAAWSGRVRAILYGGSVNQHNAAELLAIPGVDGLFVGRAAWQAEGFLELVAIAAHERVA